MDVSIQRKTFIDDIIHAHENDELDAEYLSEQLQYYEEVAEKAVGGNLQLNVTENFPVQSEKWTILQAIFFASTICTTIGKKIYFRFYIYRIFYEFLRIFCKILIFFKVMATLLQRLLKVDFFA